MEIPFTKGKSEREEGEEKKPGTRQYLDFSSPFQEFLSKPSLQIDVPLELF